VFTARYALSPYIKQIRSVFKGLNTYASRQSEGTAGLLVSTWVHIAASLLRGLRNVVLKLELLGHEQFWAIYRVWGYVLGRAGWGSVSEVNTFGQFIQCDSGLNTAGWSSMQLGHEQLWEVYRVWWIGYSWLRQCAAAGTWTVLGGC
jgi:hypothetical protein